MQRVYAYIDGFNLYFGLKTSGYRRYYWLNVQGLSHRLLLPVQRLDQTKYSPLASPTRPISAGASPSTSKHSKRLAIWISSSERISRPRAHAGVAAMLPMSPARK
jgi:hypothetical protein